ncbi:hypothetical protein RIF29_23229 [Crotalaria pallida]|uniref:G-patch domain-containing protein n=1 Tax=Crotalaria pallida TaxID=3830 RepID=A0AAN9F802_CROPI
MKLLLKSSSSSSSKLSIPIKPFLDLDSSNHQPQINNPSKHYLTQFDPSQTTPADDSVAKLVIPPLQNQWKPLNTMKNPELLPTTHPNDNDGEDITVEEFAEALLAGYGWSKGMGIGRRTREDVKVWQPKRWPGREGFGFVSDDCSRNLTRRRIGFDSISRNKH